jgi:hypothetical protein
MKKISPAADPQAYLAALQGWRLRLVSQLRDGVLAAGPLLEERIKWGHLVYFSDGPLLLIRAEAERVLLGFWRGKRLIGLLPGLKPGGNYEMATQALREGEEPPGAELIRRALLEAVRLNQSLGDPTRLS